MSWHGAVGLSLTSRACPAVNSSDTILQTRFFRHDYSVHKWCKIIHLECTSTRDALDHWVYIWHSLWCLIKPIKSQDTNNSTDVYYEQRTTNQCLWARCRCGWPGWRPSNSTWWCEASEWRSSLGECCCRSERHWWTHSTGSCTAGAAPVTTYYYYFIELGMTCTHNIQV